MNAVLIFGLICLMVALFVILYVIIDKAVERGEQEYVLLRDGGTLMDENGYPRHLGYSADLDHLFQASA